MKTDIKNYEMRRPGVIVCKDDNARKVYLAQKKLLDENSSLKEELNIMKNEVSEIKIILKTLLNKE